MSQVAILLVTVSLKGRAYINLNSLLRSPAQFYLSVVIPVCLGALCLLLSTLPRTLAINLVSLVCLLTLAEGTAWWLGSEPTLRGEPEASGQSEFYVRDPILGHALLPNTIARHKGFLGKEAIYDATYEIDDLGRRKTPTRGGSRRHHFALFFGDSNMFGYGLTQEETLPFFVGALAPDYQPYNYAVPGYGPVHVLELAKRRALNLEIKEREGVAVFFLIPGHIARVIGASEILDYGHDYPYYVLDPSGGLLAKGDFTANRQLTTLAYYFWSRSHVVQRFEVGLPLWYSEADYALTARIFAEAAARLKEKLKVRALYVVMGQAYGDQETRILGRMRAPFEREGVTYLDYTHLFDPSDPQYHLPDYHNSARANQVIARQFVADAGIGR